MQHFRRNSALSEHYPRIAPLPPEHLPWRKVVARLVLPAIALVGALVALAGVL